VSNSQQMDKFQYIFADLPGLKAPVVDFGDLLAFQTSVLLRYLFHWATKYKTPFSICTEQRGFRAYRLYCILFPLRACLGTALIRSGWAVNNSRRNAIRNRASPQIGPGQGFREEKQRTCCAEKTEYTSLPQKSRRIVFRLKVPVIQASDVGADSDFQLSEIVRDPLVTSKFLAPRNVEICLTVGTYAFRIYLGINYSRCHYSLVS